jgi:hypothetical protein
MKTSYISNSIHIVVIMFSLLFSCKEEVIDTRDPCDFFISTDEVPLLTSTNPCESCFFKFSFRGKLYNFKNDQMPGGMIQFGEGGKDIISYYNDFFEFQLKYLHRSRDLFFSLNQQRALLTPDSLKKTDFNFFQPAFVLKDRCGIIYQVAENTNIYTPDISNNTIKNITVWSSQLVNEQPPTRYYTIYLVSGDFTSRILTGKDPDYISGSYSLLYSIVEPL